MKELMIKILIEKETHFIVGGFQGRSTNSQEFIVSVWANFWLKINLDKSNLFGINLDQNHLSRLALMLDCKASDWPILYLGLPLGGNPKACGFWDPVIERISRRLDGWQKAYLSFGGVGKGEFSSVTSTHFKHLWDTFQWLGYQHCSQMVVSLSLEGYCTGLLGFFQRVLECGLRKSTADRTVSLFLSKKLEKRKHGFEYGALEVKNHLEKLLFSDIVSTVMIVFSPQNGSKTHFSPWVCHFHEIAKKRSLKPHSIIDALYMKCNSARAESKINLPDLQITSNGRDCFVDMEKEDSDCFCITVSIVNSKKSCIQLDTVRDLVIPFLLGAVGGDIEGTEFKSQQRQKQVSRHCVEPLCPEEVSFFAWEAIWWVIPSSIKDAILSWHGLLDVKKVDILWNDNPDSDVLKSSSGRLYLRVYVSGDCGKKNFWGVLMDACLQIMDMIDWERSHPDNIHDIFVVYGIDAGWKYFLNSLKSAISDIGKTVLPEHLLLVASCLSATGEFVGLNAKGMARQKELTSISSPFMQGCFSVSSHIHLLICVGIKFEFLLLSYFSIYLSTAATGLSLHVREEVYIDQSPELVPWA
ncbi:DNA-directed RNA polymerase IV subunit 1 [Vitis vinifera]|uniref:DNA-directed RNA polymerase n=1 Tax=Vitis vinifera TaxID=29760 RepID=A0A438JJC2_VITVI|nr:DNA-directed RNA polymerase IV subunit 1 [Vitis vinifera]